MRFTTKEKVRLLTGTGYWHTDSLNGKVPSIHVSDGPYGLRAQSEKAKSNNDSIKATCMPTPCAVAASFNPDTAYLMGQTIAKEAWNENVSILLGPGINIKRNPLCGRNFEYYSEDPYLAGIMGSSFINGVEDMGIGTSLKHFACNNQETRRMIVNSVVDEKALREIYLKPFEIAVKKSNPASIMASYNRINGIYACENSYLLNDVMRNEFGFKGIFVSDWGASTDLAKSLKGGLDLEMPCNFGNHRKRVLKALKKNELDMSLVDTASNRVLNTVNKYAVENRINNEKKDISNNHDIAMNIELDSAVLLKNDGILPLEKQEINIIGALAQKPRFQGGGSSHINANKVLNAIDVFNEYGFKVNYEYGYHQGDDKFDDELLNKAVELCKNGKPVLFFGGLPEYVEGEGYDRLSYDMPQNEIKLLEEILKVNKDVIFISFSGAPYNMYFKDDVRALLHMYLGGEAVMEACVRLVSGEVSPSGRLPETFPIDVNDHPSTKVFGQHINHVEYRESIFVGYRYYDTFDVDVRFPFGYGLSYTSFEYSNLKISQNVYNGGKLTISFKIKNVGACKGKISSLIYVLNPDLGLLREKRSLKAFVKCELDINEEKELTIELDEEAFKTFDINKRKWIMPTGKYEIQIGGAINDIKLSSEIKVNGSVINISESELYPKYFDKNNKLLDVKRDDFVSLYGSILPEDEPTEFSVTSPLIDLAKHSLFCKIMIFFGKKAIRSRTGHKPDTDPEVMMFMEMLLYGTLDCIVTNAAGAIKVRAEDAIILSANGHKFKALLKLLFG